VVVLVVLVVLVVGFSMGRVSTQAAGPAVHHAVPTATVHPGETLWQIAARVAPHADPRAMVRQLEALNHLSGPQVLAGQQLLLPRAG
jgi:LysM repeat protein